MCDHFSHQTSEKRWTMKNPEILCVTLSSDPGCFLYLCNTISNKPFMYRANQKWNFALHLTSLSTLFAKPLSLKKILILQVLQQSPVSSVPIQLTQMKNHQIKSTERWWKMWLHFYSTKKNSSTHMFLDCLLSPLHPNKEIYPGMMNLINEETEWEHFSHSLMSCLCCPVSSLFTCPFFSYTPKSSWCPCHTHELSH